MTRRAVKIALVVAALSVVYVLVTFVQVWHASHQDDARHAQAIIVLGAAQFNGRPSAVLSARLDHAADLYRRGLAPLIVVTGGKQPLDVFTEAEASANYLQAHGVPGGAIERETTSTNSYDELAATARFLHERGIMRAHQRVRTQSGEGEITSGGFSPTMDRSIALARVPVDAGAGTDAEIEMMARRNPARLLGLE